MSVQVSGLSQVTRNLNEQIERMGGATHRGLVRSMLLVERESKIQTPIDTGNLRGSWETSPIEETHRGPVISGGYGAEYAIYVHEDLEARHAPGTNAKFLENAFKENERDILDIIAEENRRVNR